MDYLLKNEDLTVNLSSYGAEILNLSYKGYEFMWQRDSSEWCRTSPLMFPVVGGWENDLYSVNEKSFHMQKHGFARTSDFSVINKETASVGFELISDSITRGQYPFSFRLLITYKILHKTVEVKFLIENLSDCPLPFAIGAHPGFRWVINNPETESEDALIFEKNETVDSISTSGKKRPFLSNSSYHRLEKSEFADGALCLAGIESDWVEYRNGDKKLRIHLQDFNSLVLWTNILKNNGFLCIEPVTGFRKTGNSLLNHEGVILLDKEKGCTYSYQLEII